MVHKSLNSSSNSPDSQIPWEFNDLEFAVLEACLSTWLPFGNTLERRVVQEALKWDQLCCSEDHVRRGICVVQNKLLASEHAWAYCTQRSQLDLPLLPLQSAMEILSTDCTG